LGLVANTGTAALNRASDQNSLANGSNISGNSKRQQLHQSKGSCISSDVRT